MRSTSRSTILALLVSCSCAGLAAQPSPPTIARGVAPSGEVRSMGNNQNTLASLADGAVVALIYTQTSATAGGRLELRVTYDEGKNWAVYPLPQNTGHAVHDAESGVLCAGRACDTVHVAWSDTSRAGAGLSAYYATFRTTTKRWSAPLLLARGTTQQPVFVEDITATPLDTVAVALGVGVQGGLGMGMFDSALVVRRRGAATFTAPQPMRQGGLGWSRDPSIVASEELVHCAFKNLKGAGGIAYRAFDTATMRWRQPSQVMVGPNDNGVGGFNGINAGNKAVLTKDTRGGLYILYVTGSAGGLRNNNRMRMAYAAPGKGSVNSDWTDLDVLGHNTAVGKNPRGVGRSHPSFPALQGGNTSGEYYTLAQGFQGSMIVVYSKPWEDFQNKYLQIWQYGVNVPLPVKEINFWPDTQPYMFERLGAMRSTGSVGQAAWIVYGKNDKPQPGKAPHGWIRLWAATYSTGRTISFGTGCRGSLPAVPRMQADEQFPMLGNPYTVDFRRFPANAPFYLALGTRCQTLDLGFMGAPGCELNIDFPAFVPLRANPSGVQQLNWNVPNDPKLIGRFFYSQSFVLSPGANPAGAVTSNALRSQISQ